MINESEIKQKIWEKLGKLKATSMEPLGDSRILELIAAIKGIEAIDSLLDDEKSLQLLPRWYDYSMPPLYVFNFINEIAKSVNPKSHLDPWITPSSPCNFFDFGQTIAYCLKESVSKTINTFSQNDRNQIYLGDISKMLKDVKTHFDLVTSFPPFNVKQENLPEINGIAISKDISMFLLIQSSLLLNENGKSIFLVSPSFLLDKKSFEIMNNLGLFVDAVFTIPSGSLLPTTGITSNLIVITKQENTKTFVAEISINEEFNKVILTNYKARKASKETRLGVLIDFKEFRSLQSLISKTEANQIALRLGYQPVNLEKQLAIHINAIKQTDKEEVEHLSNSIYLPKIGNSPVITNPSEMRIKPASYFQIQLDETRANAVYVANYFNSFVGEKLRKSLEDGATIPQISKTELSKCILHLPDLSTQLEIITVANKIDQTFLQVNELKKELWRQPKKYLSIVKSLNTINKEDKIEHWIDTLPFPLSSILWRYYATKDNAKKIEHLFHFFEALSEFFSMIMLSALVKNQDFYDQECHKWISKDERFKDWYLRATFGSWNILTSNLSKATRTYLADKDKQELCQQLYGNPNSAFLNMLTSKRIVNILDDVAKYRNHWKGHGGITGEEESKQRVVILEQNLNELRKYIADGFEDAKVISAKQGELEEGVWTFTAKELVGAKSPFREIELRSLIGLDKKKLYLVHSNQTQPVELLPFIKFVEISDAVYFYTSIESKNVRWVSYHFEKTPELNQPAESDLFKAFEFLKGNIS